MNSSANDQNSPGNAFSPALASDDLGSQEGVCMLGNQGTFMGKMDLATVMQTDPSLIGGFRTIFERTVPFELQLFHQEAQKRIQGEIKSNEDLIVKILLKGSEQEPTQIVVELFSQKDYFFVYKHTCSIFTFETQKEEQNLKPDFPEYLTMLIKLFTYALEKKETFKCCLHIHEDNTSLLNFKQCLQFKELIMLKAAFDLEDEDQVRRHIKYRNRLAKIQFEQMQERLLSVCAIVQSKNPSLVKHICKAIRKHQPWGQELDTQQIAAEKKNRGPQSAKSGRSGKSGKSASSLRSKRTEQTKK